MITVLHFADKPKLEKNKDIVSVAEVIQLPSGIWRASVEISK